MSAPIYLAAHQVLTSDGVSSTIRMPSAVDSVQVVNRTNFATAATGEMLRANWNSAMANGFAELLSYGTVTTAPHPTALTVISSGGVSVTDTGIAVTGAAVVTTGGTKAAPVVVSTASTAGLSNGDVVRYFPNTPATGLDQIRGYDFTIGSLVANTSFELSFMDASGAAFTASTAGTYRKVSSLNRYTPFNRLITNLASSGVSTVVTMSVLHNYQVGQLVTFNVSDAWAGWSALNGLRGKVTAINLTTNTVTVDINSSSFGVFAFPASAVLFTPAQVIPFGDGFNLVGGVAQDFSGGSLRDQTSFEVVLGSSVVGAASDVLDVFLYNSLVI